MTAPAQPQPYPGDVPAEQVVIPVRRRFVTEGGDALYGYLSARNEQTDQYVTVEVLDGEIVGDLRGTYRVVGTLSGPFGPQYIAETVTL
jgi:hypothetical protein